LPQIVIISRRFAGAVGADQRDDLAFVDVEIDALQRLDLAVEVSTPRAARRARSGAWRMAS
jgi:hypothetical protein